MTAHVVGLKEAREILNSLIEKQDENASREDVTELAVAVLALLNAFENSKQHGIMVE